jgi:hypothetical protein
MKNKMSIADKRQKRIAEDTIKNPMKYLLGGMDSIEAEAILRGKFNYSNDAINKLKIGRK